MKLPNAFVLTGSLIPIAMIPVHVSKGEMVHRWSFNNPPGPAPSGSTVGNNGTGTGDAVVRGSGAAFTGGSVSIPGGGSATAAYVDLPNFIVSDLTTATVEAWYTVNGIGHS